MWTSPANSAQVHENEVMRAFKTVNDQYIEPISFTVPRRAETFQSDIFPPATGLKPAVSAKEWLDGKDGIPAKIDLESIYDGNGPVEVSADYKPPPPMVQSPPPSAAKPPARSEPEPKPAARAPPPTMRDQETALKSTATKYRDSDEEEDDDDDASSFEEISRPPPRTLARDEAPAIARATPPSELKASYGVRGAPKAAQAFSSPPPASIPVTRSPPPAKEATREPVREPTRMTQPPSSASGSVESSLDQIKQLIEAQTKIISAQNAKIDNLAAELEALKKKVGASSQDQSERIRQLELELEAARS